MKSVEDNPITAAKVNLGKLLYFDPILSGENTNFLCTLPSSRFCFSDGRKTSMGLHGKGWVRSGSAEMCLHEAHRRFGMQPTIQCSFWDGRATNLEQQAGGPIQDAHEMNQNADDLVRELLKIPEYVRLFRKTFGGKPEEAVNLQQCTKAIATFERTILSFDSKFDRFAAGDSTALKQFRKAWPAAFRSLKTRCFECHAMPNFSDGSFRVVGVPDCEGQTRDPGRAKVPGQEPDGASRSLPCAMSL